MSETDNKRTPVNERRRDRRISVSLPFLLTDPEGTAQWQCRSVDISPTGLLLELDRDRAPAPGRIVNAMVQGPAETGWEHINRRPMRVVRVEAQRAALAYVDLGSSDLAEGAA